ncbi:MAG: hypothetical protein U0X76_11675 [Bacteroidia bacterium]
MKTLIRLRHTLLPAFLMIILAMAGCKKDETTTTNNNNNTGGGGGSMWKGTVNSGQYSHGCILRSDSTARYLIDFYDATLADTNSSNVAKFEGNYQMIGADSIIIYAASGSTNFILAGKMNTGHTTMTGLWRYDAGIGIINTLPFSMSK